MRMRSSSSNFSNKIKKKQKLKKNLKNLQKIKIIKKIKKKIKVIKMKYLWQNSKLWFKEKRNSQILLKILKSKINNSNNKYKVLKRMKLRK